MQNNNLEDWERLADLIADRVAKKVLQVVGGSEKSLVDDDDLIHVEYTPESMGYDK